MVSSLLQPARSSSIPSSNAMASLLQAFSRLSLPQTMAGPSRLPLHLLSNPTASRNFATTPSNSTWGARKPKTHSGTAKRFKAVGFQRVTRPTPRPSPLASLYLPSLDSNGNLTSSTSAFALNGLESSDPYSPSFNKLGGPLTKRLAPMFKRGQVGKRHLNGNMHRPRKARLRKGALHSSGPTNRALRRLLGPRL